MAGYLGQPFWISGTSLVRAAASQILHGTPVASQTAMMARLMVLPLR